MKHELIEDLNELKCDDCGTTNNVTATICPYAEEIHGEEVAVELCDHCYHERGQDI
jgi:hypothetical protein